MNRAFTYILTLGLLMIGGVVMGQRTGGTSNNGGGEQTQAHGVIVGGSVFGGGNLANVAGSSTVTINQANASIGEDVYGGGAKALVNTSDGSNHTDGAVTTVTLTQGTVGRDLYGGGLGQKQVGETPAINADVFGDVTVNVNGGAVVGRVFGCNNLQGAPKSNVIVNIEQTGSSMTVHDVFGGGNEADATVNPVVNIKAGAISKIENTNNGGNVFGGGNQASIGGTTVNVTGGSIASGLYGGCNTSGNVTDAILVNVTGGQIGASGNGNAANIHGGGYGNQTTTSGNVTVNFGTTGTTHSATPTLYGDLYGGSGFGNVNNEATDLTTVNILNGEINGSVYGGGLGSTSPNYAALVNGKVTVNIGSVSGTGTSATYSGKASITGEVFGCNNANGTPKDDVAVNIYMTNHTFGNTPGVDDNRYPSELLAMTTGQLQAFQQLPNTDAQYALKAVYGGGNLAEYAPASVESGETPHKATVHVYQCSENTIKAVYGGCNAADASNVSVIIDGGRFDQVFGGGNGAGDTNPGANITETAATRIHGGLFNQIFGGSDTKGDVGTVDLVIDNESGCLELINESFGGANKAVIHGDVTTTLACSQIQIGSFYGGSNLADIIDGDVTLNVLGGIYNNVFGGSKGDSEESANIIGDVTLNLYGGTMVNAFGGSDVNGNITGKITVNVLDKGGSCSLSVQNIYGGGRDAAYTPVIPSGENELFTPEVNLINTQVINVYGGGYGSTATVSSSPVVVIGSTTLPEGQTLPQNPSVSVTGNVFGGGEEAPVAGSTYVTIQNAYSSVGGIFGGGNQASVGNATVNVNGGLVSAGVYGGCNEQGTVGGVIPTNSCTVTPANGTTTVTITQNNNATYDGTSTVNLNGGTIGANTNATTRANVYGGGLGTATNVYGTVALEVKGSTIYGDVYGGSAKGLVNCTVNSGTQSHTADKVTGVTITSGNIIGDVYGGGHGPGGEDANVWGPVTVTMNGGNIKTYTNDGVKGGNIFGGNNVAGTPKDNITVNINANVTNSDNTTGCVYGGGNLASYIAPAVTNDRPNNPVVVVNNGAMVNVFGGGLGAAAAVTGNPKVTIGDNNGSHYAVVSGNVYGGGDQAPVIGSTTVTYNDNNTTSSSVGKLFGGGNNIAGNNGVSGASTVTLTSGKVTDGLYGGCNTSGTVGGDITVALNGGTIGDSENTEADVVFGGGYGHNTATTGSIEVTLGTSVTEGTNVYGNLYGGSALGSVNAADKTTTVTLTSATLYGKVFGGGMGEGSDADHKATTLGAATVNINVANTAVTGIYGGANVNGNVAGAINVNVNANVGASGTNRDIYGGGLGANTTTDGTVTVTIDGTANPTIYGDIYGGSAFGEVSASGILTKVDFQKGTLHGTIYGGGKGQTTSPEYSATVSGNVEVAIADGSISNGIYGGCNAKGNVVGDITVNVNGGTIGTSGTRANIHGGGYGNLTGTSGDVTVNYGAQNATHQAVPTLYGDLYGGSGFGNVNSSNSTTTVNVLNGEITGDVYGGGLGSTSPNYPALVNGDVEVYVGKVVSGTLYGKADIKSYTVGNTTKGGNVFGCNNVNGTPKGMVAVTVNSTNTPAANTYAIQGVYGGGNVAHYDPTDPMTSYPTVTINNCSTSVKDVFGGGNAAAVTKTNVIVNGGNIDRVFAGGNGESGTAANVGYKNADETPTANSYGPGTANATIKGGTINKVFGGSNSKGTIRANGQLDIAKEGDCPMDIEEVYGGGNFAKGAPATVNIGCTGTGTNEIINYVYGGANNADVTGNIELNIKGGRINNVFGGNNNGGSISGTVKVNVNWDDNLNCGTNGNYLGNVYGGGNVAPYTYSGDYPEVNIIKGTVSENVFGGGLGESARVTGNPVVNISGGTLTETGKVFGGGSAAPVTGNPTVNAYYGTAPTIHGGGLGASAIVTGNPKVVVNQTSGKTLTVTNVFGGGDAAGVTGYTTVQLQAGTVTNAFGGGNVADITGTTLVSLEGATATAASIYGGGNMASVSSTTTVNISNGSVTTGVYGGCNTSGTVGGTATVNVTGGTVGTDATHTANIYGGGLGQNTKVKGDVAVTIGQSGSSTGATIYGDVYGGSAKGLINCNDDGNGQNGSARTDVTLNAGTVNGNLYGGGHGLDGKEANVWGPVKVTVDGANTKVTNVFGCNNLLGTPKNTVEVFVNKTAATVVNGGNKTYAIQGVYGGGNEAHFIPTSSVEDYPKVTINDCSSSIKDVYGGGNAAGVPNTNVIINGGDIDRIFAGGNGESGTPAHIGYKSTAAEPSSTDIYGTGNAKCTIHGGTINQMFGGSNSNGLVRGESFVTIEPEGDCPLVLEEVFCGSNEANIVGDVTTTIECKETNYTIGALYGGSNKANITGNVSLTVEGGKYNYIYGGSKGVLNGDPANISGSVTLNINGGTVNNAVFGGSNQNGSIGGNITVTIENTQSGACALNLSNADVFGGGNLARYGGTPKVYIKNGTVANVYGGGNGDPDDESQEPGQVAGAEVTIGDIVQGHEDYLAVVTGNVYGGGNAAKVTGTTTVLMQKANTAVSGDIYGGGNLANVTGSTVVNLNGGTVTQDVYGGGALANTGGSTVTLGGGTVRALYGGGLGRNAASGGITAIPAQVTGAVQVTVNSGSVTDVYGCNNVNGAPTNTVRVDINNNVGNNVYGGGNLAASTITPAVYVNTNGNVTGSVFGGGNQAGVGGGNVNIVGGTVQGGGVTGGTGGVFGGCNTSGTSGNIVVNVNSGTIGASGTPANVHGGGFGSSTGTTGNVDVNIAQTNATSGATIWGDVYGGSALGSVNGTAVNTTNHTNVTMNKGTIHGNLYGGGLGQAGVEAKVWSPVQVTVNSGTVTGSVYGCNNVSGAPQSTVKVDVYGTDEASGSNYALANVFGGGNQAAYNGTPEVTIHYCDNNIGYVYGGGNAAAVKGTDVTVYGGNTIGNVFGGCYGADVTTDGTNVKIRGGRIGKVFGGNNSSGTINGSVLLNVNKQAEGTGAACDMKIGEVYGGGNLAAGNAGTINIGCTGALTNEHSTHPENIGTSLEGIGAVYGGANQADIGTTQSNSNITLNINSGIINSVFGGNNTSGEIHGTITVNVNKNSSSCGWYVGNVFGGGNLAAYTGSPAVNIKNGTVSGNVYGGGKGELVASTNQNHGMKGKVTGNPHVTVGGFDSSYTASVLGDVYGGGDAANVAGTPVVEVNACNTTVGDLYGGGNAADVTGTSVTVNGGTISHAYGGGHGDKTVTTEPLKYADVNGDVTFNVYGGTIAQVFAGSNSKGNITGSSNLTVDKTGSCAMKLGEVYGGGNEADGNAGTVTIGCTGDWTTTGTNNHSNHNSTNNRIGYELEGIGTVYGGANQANIGSEDEDSDITLTINKGIVENVFGGNNTSGTIYGDIQVNINQIAGCDWYVGDVYGGGNHAPYGRTPDVNIIAGTVSGNVYGGGNDITVDNATTPAGVAGSDVEMTGGAVLGSVYGGCNEKGSVTGSSQVKIYGGEIGSQALLNAGTVSQVFGGGLGEATKVNGNVTVTVNKTGSVAPVIYGDVYGGSARGSVNTGSSNTTTVNILDGTLITKTGTGDIIDPATNNVIGTYTIYNGGNVFGGGLGLSGASNVDKGKVNGVVTVNIGEKHTSTTQGNDHQNYTYTGNATIQGSVYGCNNTNGSPQQDVTVNVYKTAHTDANAFGGSGYAIANVFGGGNEANYAPASTGHKVSVNVFDCINTIGRVFGGGNAAHVGTEANHANAVTDILGGRIGQVFGGGNGERGTAYAANIYGDVLLGVHGGTMGQLFGGSNQNGAISGSIGITVNDNGCGNMVIDEFFCGGNFVDVNGDLETDITCSDGMTVNNLYGGCNMANITGHVVLNVYGGEFTNVYGGSKGDLASLNQGNEQGHIDKAANINGYVTLNLFGGTITNAFGGSNVNGNIYGPITVNVIDKVDTNCPLNITNIYGGSNMTNYQPTSSSITSPVVNVMHVNNSIGGNVYGGSKGVEGASNPVKVKANPLVNIGYDANSMSSYVPKDINNQPIVPVPAAPKAVIAGKVFGGGDAAEVEGSTTVWMRQVGTGANTQVSQDIYGGGNLADVSGSTSVNVNGGTVTQDVYGGGALADVNVTNGVHTNGATTSVTLAGGTVRDIYGGGLGSRETGNVVEAKVYGPVSVAVNGGTVTNVFGCNNENGAPQSTVQVDIEKTGSTMSVTNVFGGGNLAAYAGSPVVNIKNGTVSGNVYGGGNGSSSDNTQTLGSTGAPTVTIGDANNLTNNNVKAVVAGDVYGGGNAAKVTGTTAPTVSVLNKCNTEIGYVYGGGNAADVPATNVTIAGGTVHHDVFGGGHGDNTQGSEKAANVTNNVNVSVTGAKIDRVFAGSNLNGTIGGNVTLSIAKADNANCEMKIGEVYGGGNEAAGNAGSITIGCTGDWTTTGTNNHTNHNNTNNRIGYELEGIGAVYGGANKANIGTAQNNSNITLNIVSGIIENVFGGNNTSGTINGTITVNVNKNNSNCGWYVGNVYGGGNQADYTTPSNTQNYPVVNILNGTVSGDVFGGGLGVSGTEKGKVTGNPQVTINGANAIVNGTNSGVYGGGSVAPTEGNPVVTLTTGTVANIYGGGKAASVTGATTVNVNGGTVDKTGTTDTGNVYGGCNSSGTVSSTTKVNITNGTVEGSVFGGGFGSGTEVTGKATVEISGANTAVNGDVYGGGNQGEVKGGTDVKIKNAN